MPKRPERRDLDSAAGECRSQAQLYDRERRRAARNEGPSGPMRMNALRLDIENESQLLDYLYATERLTAGEHPAVRVLTGGVSNRAVLVERTSDVSLVVKQALNRLRVAVEWYSDPNRIFREAAALRALESLLPAGSTPHFLFEDADARLFAMSAVPSSAENWKDVLLSGRIDSALVRSFGALLGTMHRTAYERNSELQLEESFKSRTLFESLRVEPYYAYTAEREPDARAFLWALIDDVRASAVTFVHGDYSPKNVLVDGARLVLLDYEVAHWGDPAFDIGFALTHLFSKAHHVAARRADFATAARTFWHSYVAEVASLEWSHGLEQRAVRHAAACLLARVSGRSPLEYLSDSEKAAQRASILALVCALPPRVDDFADAFLENL